MHCEAGQPYIPDSGKAYRPLAEHMVRSFKASTDDDEQVVQFADADSSPIAGIDLLYRQKITRENMMVMRVQMLRDYFAKSSRNIIACDVDMVWRKNPRHVFDAEFDVGVCWRTGQPSMPYLGCLLFVKHTEAALAFLSEWWVTVACMPLEMQAWWGDQLGLASLLGRQNPNTTINFNGCRVKIFDAGQLIYTVKDQDQRIPEGVYVTHYKGDKKEIKTNV